MRLRAVELGQFQEGTASGLRAFDDATPPKLCNSSPAARIINCTGGTWCLRRLKLENKAGNAGPGNHFPVCISASGGASVSLYGMELDLRFVLGTGETKDEGYYLCRMLTATTSGVLSIRARSGYQTKLTYDKGAADGLQVIHMERNGAMQLPSDSVADTNTSVLVAPARPAMAADSTKASSLKRSTS